MKDPEDFVCLSTEDIDLLKSGMRTVVESLNKNEIVSVKSMILPPMFTFNVLRIMMVIMNPRVGAEITWNMIKKDLLVSAEVLKRRLSFLKVE